MHTNDDVRHYKCGWLIDGSGSPAKKNIFFSIKGQYFDYVSDFNYTTSSSKNIINLSSYTVLPSFVDTHVHLAFSGTTNFTKRKEQLSKKYHKRNDIIYNNIKNHLLNGVSAVRDAGDPCNDVLTFKKKMKHHPLTIFSPGMAWHNINRYGNFIGNSLKSNMTLPQSINLECQNRDHIKIINSGLNSLSVFGAQTVSQFKTSDIKVAVTIAKSFGKKIMIHANGLKPVKSALLAGCNSIEHGFFMNESNLSLMAQQSIVWVPTIFTMQACIDNLNKKNTTNNPLGIKIASKNLDHQLYQLSLAKKLGVTVTLGTDSGSPGIDHGRSIQQELKLLLKSGYTIEQTIRCATRNGAKLINCLNTGLINKGMKANFIVIKGNPSNILKNLSNIKFFFLEGKQIF